ncbi:hypothetical protein STEG23_032722, partial [Scotinomys teguina]
AFQFHEVPFLPVDLSACANGVLFRKPIIMSYTFHRGQNVHLSLSVYPLVCVSFYRVESERNLHGDLKDTTLLSDESNLFKIRTKCRGHGIVRVSVPGFIKMDHEL